ALTATASAEQSLRTSDASSLLNAELLAELGWKQITLVRLGGSNGELLGLLLLADASTIDQPQLLSVTRLISASLENSRLFTQITQASKQWAEIFDALSDFIVLHDDQQRVMRVNRAFADFIGVRPPELIGIHMRELLARGGNVGMQPCPFCVQGTDRDDFH